MTPQDELRLSFYRKVKPLHAAHGIYLVQHVESGRLFVRKQLAHYDRRVYEVLQRGRFPGIPAIEEMIEADGVLILIEEYIPGQTLEQILNTRLFTETETVLIMRQLCAILQPLHGFTPPVIHRDIKASNVMLTESGQVYLIDFDAAKLYDPDKSRDTILIGTEQYAAPEQYGFGQSDCRTDIYAAGVLMCKMLTGKTLSEADYDGSLSDIIRLCTQMDPAHRFKTVEALTHALEQHDSAPVAAAPGGVAASEAAGGAQASGVTVPVNAAPQKKSFLRQIPGFKSGRSLPAIAAVIWYVIILVLTFTTEFRDKDGTLITGFEEGVYRLFALSLFLLETFYLGNAFGWRDRFPLKKRRGRNLIFGIIRVFLGALLIFGACLLIASILILLVE